jgi:hypothetical protein
VIPDDAFISLGDLANATGRNPEELGRQFEAKGLEIEYVGRGWGWVKKRDCPAVFGEARARSLTYGWTPDFVSPGIAAGILHIAASESLGLCERRGCAVRRFGVHPTISRSSVIYLGKILAYEYEMELPAEDWIDPLSVLPLMRSSQSTMVSGHAAEFWQEGIDYTDANAPRVSPYGEISVRCRWSGIRYMHPPVRQRRRTTPPRIPLFDVYRLLGVAVPGSDVASYDAMMREAYQAILGTPAAPSSFAELEVKAG